MPNFGWARFMGGHFMPRGECRPGESRGWERSRFGFSGFRGGFGCEGRNPFHGGFGGGYPYQSFSPGCGEWAPPCESFGNVFGGALCGTLLGGLLGTVLSECE
jgi:hypothetical protein